MTLLRKQPVIKWAGSKRLQASKITALFPPFETFYDPFVGGGSILSAKKDIKAIAGDICEPLIKLWQLIQKNPSYVIEKYAENWNLLQKKGYTYYYLVRDRFNKEGDATDLLFLSRTCVNGLIRFNLKGKFNNSLHHTRKGIRPDSLSKIIFEWSDIVKNVTFIHGDYRETTCTITKNDLIYLDPPYFNTRGRYYGRIDFEEFIKFLELLNSKQIKFVLSLDGTRGNKNYTVELPKHLYKRCLLIDSGNSPFKKVIDRQLQNVKESVYLNYDFNNS